MNGLVWTIAGAYILLIIVLHVPAMQTYIGTETAHALSRKFGTNVTVGRVDLGLMNRIIIDDVYFYDQKGKLMLKAARVSAKFDMLPLIHGKIHISSAQLFSFDANFYKVSAKLYPNYQFVLDSLASKDTTSKSNLDIRINSLIVRRGNISYNKYYIPCTNGKLNLSHINITKFNGHVLLKALNSDSMNVNIKKMSLRESSGLIINNMNFKFEANHKKCMLSGLNIEMPSTHVEIDTMSATYKFINNNIIPATLQFYGGIHRSQITLKDFSCFIPKLKKFTDPVYIMTDFSGTSTQLRIKKLKIYSAVGINLMANGSLKNWNGGKLTYYAHVSAMKLSTDCMSNIYSFINSNEGHIPEIFKNLGYFIFSGELGGVDKSVFTRGIFETGVGKAKIDAGIRDGSLFNIYINTDNINIGKLTGNNMFGNMSTDISVNGKLNKNKITSLNAKGIVKEINYNRYSYKNISIDGLYESGIFDGNLSLDDPNGAIDLRGILNLRNKKHRFNLTAEVKHFSPSALKITDKWNNTVIDVNVNANISATNINDAVGKLDISNLKMASSSKTFTMKFLSIVGDIENNIHKVSMESDFANAEIVGHYDNNTIIQSIVNFIGRELPTLPGLPKIKNSIRNNNFAINAQITNSEWINYFFGIPLTLNSPISLKGSVDDKNRRISIIGNMPNFTYNGTHYASGMLYIGNPEDTLRCDVSLIKYTNAYRSYNMSVNAKAINNRLSTIFEWNNHSHHRNQFSGKIATETRFYKNDEDKATASINVLPSHIIINDTIWNMEPSTIDFYANHLFINNFTIKHDQQHLIVNGVASNSKKDSLIVDLHDANVEYILDVVNFHPVEFSGLASGKVFISSAFSNPSASTKLNINNFRFEDGRMGVLHVDGTWNNKDKQIDLSAIADDSPVGMTYINGYVSPSRNYIDLTIQPQNTNIEFINSFLKSVMSNIQGRTTGQLHLYGPFNDINLTGKLNLNGETTVKSLNTKYQLRDDSIIFIPDEIQFIHTPISDKYNNVAYIDGQIHHKHLTNLSYDLGVQTDKLLCYDFHEFGDGNIYGTVITKGNIDIHGKSGQVTIDVNATPLSNSTFVYNAANPDAITNQQFITWDDKSNISSLRTNSDSVTHEEKEVESHKSIASNIYINFLITCTQDATLKVMMDNTTNDYLSLNGDGVIRATYYNKGAFNMFGTYEVDHGVYKLTIQDILHKDFQFNKGGSIVFGGNPYDAALNLQALYTVNGVSLSDLNVGNSFSNNNVRVNCIMNISGQPKQPIVNFDIDLPTVNSDEKQMVRSLINSEEDMNQQVIYLLGIGRFYKQKANNSTADGTTQQSQTTLAMQSLLSGTLSGQLNNMLSNIIKNNKWNFGANISTGNEGWNNAEYEGLLSGRLLNNRLLINGQFGYRNSLNTNTTNFVGDFDIQYLLLPNGNIAVKGYNQTNDRYFTKSSLNTQGIGIVMKKDFNGVGDLFRLKKNKQNINKKK